MFVVYAHRGASEYAPENTMSSFFMGLAMGANGIETDIQRTKDGVPVLFHDRTLERVMGEAGAIADYTYEELCRMRVRHAGSGRCDIVVRLEDFLHYCGAQGVRLALELKSPGVECDTYALVKKYHLEEQVTVTSFSLDFLVALKAAYPEASLGYLTEDFDDAMLEKMKQIGIGQLCPRGTHLTPEKVAKWHADGFEVRAWGIANVELMKHAYDCGVDGMTVNFPDRLIAYMVEKQGAGK
jgi:glycerophosphoryl diester phosphodiesterase